MLLFLPKYKIKGDFSCSSPQQQQEFIDLYRFLRKWDSQICENRNKEHENCCKTKVFL